MAIENSPMKTFWEIYKLRNLMSEGYFTRSVGGLGPNRKKAGCSHEVSNTGVRRTSKCLKQPIIVK